MRFLLDSVIVIDHFNGIEAATAFFKKVGADCAISAITRAETLTGFSPEGEGLAPELLDLFPTLPMTRAIAAKAAGLRRRERWKLPNAIQAVIAIQYELTFLMWDTDDFNGHNRFDVLAPYEP